VFQNVPNPFKDETRIEFMLDKDGPVSFTVTDQTGRLLYTERKDYKSGMNKILFNSQSVDGTGLLYYQIATDSHTSTRKMIVLQ
jgi:hypothetical protein